jgi:hypothetical protein
MMEIDKRLKEIEIKFIGDYDWIKLRDIMVLKMQDCKTEKDFVFSLKAFLGSFFLNAKAIDEARGTLGINPLTKQEKNKIKKIGKKKKC